MTPGNIPFVIPEIRLDIAIGIILGVLFVMALVCILIYIHGRNREKLLKLDLPTTEEKQLLAKYRKLDENDKNLINETIDKLNDKTRPK
ncbi:MAG: hypothetical protein HFK08_08340 [Clostridia bacterium]|nr:hypothetical protein [Clostridia bacterium]